MAISVIKNSRATKITGTTYGNFSTVFVNGYKGTEFITVGGYFSHTSSKNGYVAHIDGVNVQDASNLSTPCQCDDGSVKWVTFENNGSNLDVYIAATLTANKFVRFIATLPLA